MGQSFTKESLYIPLILSFIISLLISVILYFIGFDVSFFVFTSLLLLVFLVQLLRSVFLFYDDLDLESRAIKLAIDKTAIIGRNYNKGAKITAVFDRNSVISSQDAFDKRSPNKTRSYIGVILKIITLNNKYYNSYSKCIFEIIDGSNLLLRDFMILGEKELPIIKGDPFYGRSWARISSQQSVNFFQYPTAESTPAIYINPEDKITYPLSQQPPQNLPQQNKKQDIGDIDYR